MPYSLMCELNDIQLKEIVLNHNRLDPESLIKFLYRLRDIVDDSIKETNRKTPKGASKPWRSMRDASISAPCYLKEE